VARTSHGLGNQKLPASKKLLPSLSKRFTVFQSEVLEAAPRRVSLPAFGVVALPKLPATPDVDRSRLRLLAGRPVGLLGHVRPVKCRAMLLAKLYPRKEGQHPANTSAPIRGQSARPLSSYLAREIDATMSALIVKA
jgi:hypothetical protein